MSPKMKLKDEYDGVCYVPYVKKISRNNYESHIMEKDKISPCCESMENGLKQRDPIGFGKEYSRSPISLFIFGEAEMDCGSTYQVEYPINYCPFCGAKIELDCVKRLKESIASCKEVVTKVPEYKWVEE